MVFKDAKTSEVTNYQADSGFGLNILFVCRRYLPLKKKVDSKRNCGVIISHGSRCTKMISVRINLLRWRNKLARNTPKDTTLYILRRLSLGDNSNIGNESHGISKEYITLSLTVSKQTSTDEIFNTCGTFKVPLTSNIFPC